MKRRGVWTIILTVALTAGCVPLPAAPMPSGAVLAPTAHTAASEPPAAPSALEATPDPPATVVALSRPRSLGSYPSPDGAWQAEVTRYDCVKTAEGEELALDVLTLARPGEGTPQVVDRQLQHCGGLGAFGLGGLFWSPGGRYFYYTTAREGQPDGGCGPWTPPISRVDVMEGGTETLAGAVASPDRSRLAGWQFGDQQGWELTVWDVEGDELVRTAAAVVGVSPGAIAWAPDGAALAYLLVQNPCMPAGVTWVIRVALPGGQQTTLLESARPSFTDLAWEEAGALTLQAVTGETWRYDLATGRLEVKE